MLQILAYWYVFLACLVKYVGEGLVCVIYVCRWWYCSEGVFCVLCEFVPVCLCVERYMIGVRESYGNQFTTMVICV